MEPELEVIIWPEPIGDWYLDPPPIFSAPIGDWWLDLAPPIFPEVKNELP